MTTNTQIINHGNASNQNKPEPESDQTAEAEEVPESTTVTQLMPDCGHGSPYEVEWLVEAGDTVQKGQVIVEVTTDYDSLKLESEFNGVIAKTYGGWRDNLGVGGSTHGSRANRMNQFSCSACLSQSERWCYLE